MTTSTAEETLLQALRAFLREATREDAINAAIRATRHTEVLSTSEACKALGCSVRQLRYWIASGKLTTVGLDRRTRITRASIDSLLASGPVRGASRRGTRTGTRPR